MPWRRLASVSAGLVCLLFAADAASQENDLEQAFFEDAAAMEADYRRSEQAAFEAFQREVQALWGEFVSSTRKDWVAYSEDRAGRSVVDFAGGEVTVEVLVPAEEAGEDPGLPAKRLVREIERLVADRGTVRDYPLPETASVEPADPTQERSPVPSPLLTSPVLAGQLRDGAGSLVTMEKGRAFAEEIVEARPVRKAETRTGRGSMIKAGVTFSLVPDHLRIRASRYLDPVRQESKRFDVPVPLVLAVIHTESYFNPKATSPVPAYGLMQLVPRSGARDAYQYVYGEERLLGADYLYRPGKNIELGCAYLGLLKTRYFGRLRLSESVLYCTVASYNTGPGNVSRAFCGRKDLRCALERADAMTAPALYAHLRARLPYRETRKYIERVIERMELYQAWE